MKVALFVTCLVDQLFPNVGISCVKVLRRLGCDVIFDDRQTCCGQPAFNTGYRSEARELATHFIETFEASEAEAIVAPSGSCVAMVKHFAELFKEDPQLLRRAEVIGAKTFEFSYFLVNVLKAEVEAQFNAKVTWHDACHGLRELGLYSEPRQLLSAVKECEFVEMPNSETCCGFGGTFSVKYPEISTAIVDSKLDAIDHTNADVVVSGDVSCLMQIGGRLSRNGSRVRAMHIAEVLAGDLEVT